MEQGAHLVSLEEPAPNWPRRVGIGAGIVVALLAMSVLWPHRLRQVGPFPDPEQKELAGGLDLPAPPGCSVHATDSYELEALIVSRNRFHQPPLSDLSPVDFALAWGELTVEPNISGIEYSQDSRWYEYRFRSGAINVPPAYIATHSANTHIIPDPTNPGLAKRLLGFRRGDVVHLKGYLVAAGLPSGGPWASSRTRTDTGNRSCEIMYVTEAEKTGSAR